MSLKGYLRSENYLLFNEKYSDISVTIQISMSDNELAPSMSDFRILLDQSVGFLQLLHGLTGQAMTLLDQQLQQEHQLVWGQLGPVGVGGVGQFGQEGTGVLPLLGFATLSDGLVRGQSFIALWNDKDNFFF